MRILVERMDLLIFCFNKLFIAISYTVQIWPNIISLYINKAQNNKQTMAGHMTA